jgi:ferredoxin
MPNRFTGFVTAAVLRTLLPIGDYEAYICGPAGFMQAMYDLLVDLGVREENIAYEFFGPAKRLTRGGSTAAPILVAPTVAPPADAANIVVRFATSGLEARWDGSHRTLLEFAEAQGLQPAFSCRNGICMTCQCAIEGRVSYVEEPLDMPADGHALLCCSVPDGPVTLEL